MDRLFVTVGSLSAFFGVVLGAFAAHGLKARMAPELLAAFEVGVRYQMYHALGLIAVGFACARWRGRCVVAAGWLFIAGTLLFCGSLYALSMGGIRWIGAVTPVGGLAFLCAWLCLAWAPWRR